ncbi:MAG: DUF354 domain-containing protein [Candidatus Heimdallarchaeota archaeon]
MVSKKIVWFDVLTPKQAMLFLSIGDKLKKYGIEPHYTTRDHDYIHDIFKFRNLKPVSIGGYGGKTLSGKLLESARRVVSLSENIVDLEEKPITAISFSSPDASRVAFGLGIPLILLNDTAHSVPVAKLTFSLAKYLITPSCIDKKTFIQYGATKEMIHQYKGVDEVEYLAGENYQKYLQLRNKAVEKNEWHLVLRPEESFASYMKDKDSTPYLEVIEETIKHYKGEIIVFPRYEKQKEVILEKFEGQVTIPSNGFHFLDMLSKADVVITGGGTMARESALLGVPSVTYFWRYLEPQAFIEEKGFPSYSVQTINDAKKIIKKICAEPNQYWKDTSKLLTELEKPSDVLLPLLKNDEKLKGYFK